MTRESKNKKVTKARSTKTYMQTYVILVCTVIHIVSTPLLNNYH